MSFSEQIIASPTSEILFGAGVAISRDGTTVVISAPFDNGAAGRIYVYTGPGFATQTILAPSGTTVTNGDFGYAVAVSDDGSVIAAGSPTEPSGGGKGKVWIFHGASWASQTVVTGSDLAGPSDSFGASVAVSGDGTIVGAGAPGRASSQGRAYLYHGASWSTETKLLGGGASVTSSSQFGSSIALSTDGTTAAVGAQNHPPTGGSPNNAGRVIVYSGVSWATETVLNAASQISGGQFGTSVALSGDGTVLAVGSPPTSGQGKAYVRYGASWATETLLSASDGHSADDFGRSVTISDDGRSVVIGADFGGSGTKGQAYLYDGASYATETILAASDGTSGDQFGYSVSTSGPADLVLVGAYFWGPAGSVDGTGQAYLYSLPPAAPEGVGIAFGSDAFAATPGWVSIADRIQTWRVDRGRSFELDKTQTGAAEITIIDTDGTFDPTNSGGPYYGNLDPDKPVAISITDPVTNLIGTVFTGFIEDIEVEVDVSEKFSTVTITAVDMMDRLANIEVVPGGSYGTTAPAASDGDVFYASQQVDDRIKAALADAGIPVGLQSIFSGNVSVQDTVYAARTPILQVIQDAADGEFPGVANFFISKMGIATFHGRLARFDPHSYESATDAGRTAGANVCFWKAGDRTAYIGSPTDTALISRLTFDRSKSKLINAALASPDGILDADVAGQVVIDSGSITTYGVRSQSFENLITQQGDETGTPDANDETKKFATYYVENFHAPRNRISQIRVVSQPPTSAYAETWRFLTGVEISDVVTVTTTHPGGGGFNEDFYVEGIHYEASPMNETNPYVMMTLDLSPAAYFTDNPFS